VLDIPDEYKFMDQELVEELEARVGSFLSWPGVGVKSGSNQAGKL